MTDNNKPATAIVTVCGANYEFSGVAFGEAVARWKASLVGAATTVQNADTLFGRAALVALLSGSVTPKELAFSAYKAFAPRNAKGVLCAPKVQGDRVESVSSLRNAKGGDNARKSLDALFDVHATMTGRTDADGANIMAPAVLAFVNAEKGAASSIRKLAEILTRAAIVHAESLGIMPADDKGDAKGDASDASDASEGDAKAPALSNDSILALAAAIESASDDELSPMGDALGILLEVIAARFNIGEALAQAA